MEPAEKAYYQSILEHQFYIHKAFNTFGADLCKKANVNVDDLEKLINKHDMSKFSEGEFNGYRQWFFPNKRNSVIIIKDEKEPNIIEFEKACKHHYSVNPHHPEYWLDNNGNPKEIPTIYVIEMILNWSAESMKFHTSLLDWYANNKEHLKIESFTKNKIEYLIELIGEDSLFRNCLISEIEIMHECFPKM